MSTSLLNASSLFANAYYGLQNAYQYALPNGANGVTQSDLLGANNKYGILQSSQNMAFSSYLATHFNQLDTNKDGKITGDEMSSVMSTFSKQGMSYEQLMALSGTNGVNSQDLNNIITNFRKIDRNGDGKVSQAEINYYNANKQISDKITELKKSRCSDISIMYSDDDKDNDSSSSSSNLSPISSII